MNSLLKKYSLPSLSVEKYRQIFCFPVIDYYKKLGFDFDKYNFLSIGAEFINQYNKNLYNCSLNENALYILKIFKEKKIPQIIISAREQNSLLKDLKNFGIISFFDKILGIDNNYAAGKETLFDNFLSKINTKNQNIFIIGDTNHDCEIAKKFKLNFIYFSKGHQNASHFKNCNISKTINNLKKLENIL
jgi:phosphoglycolate phosphatase